MKTKKINISQTQYTAMCTVGTVTEVPLLSILTMKTMKTLQLKLQNLPINQEGMKRTLVDSQDIIVDLLRVGIY